MAKAKNKKEEVRELTQEEKDMMTDQQCLKEINDILVKYQRTLVPYNRPQFRLVKVEQKADEQETTEA